MKSYYDIDKKLEEVFAHWLDSKFYEQLAKQELIIGWYRVNGEKLQKKGKDVILIINADEEHIIDEKATLHYINKDIPTFAFEIKNRTSGAEGWLFNDNLSTEYYLLAWPNGENLLDGNYQFTSSKIMLINKKDVLELLEENGLSKASILELVNQYSKLASKQNNSFRIKSGIKLNFNFTLHEKPINLVISRELLKDKANFYGEINSSGEYRISEFKI